MPGNYEILAARNIQRFIDPLVDRRQNPIAENLTLLRRTPEVERTEGEIVATETATVYAADIIADDQKAVVRTADVMTLQTNKIPNLKHGVLITQEMVKLLRRINAGQIMAGEDNSFRRYVARRLQRLLLGIDIRKEALLWQARLDNGFYDRLGIKFNGVSWGTPAALKVTPSTYWTSTASLPITDIENLKAAAAIYGKTYNRIELSTTSFNNMIATDQFKAQANLFSGAAFPVGSVPFANPTIARTLAGNLLGMAIEIQDFQYAEQSNDGSTKYSRFMPVNKVVLSNTADDNNVAARAFAKVVPSETEVGDLPGVQVVGGGVGPPRIGPIGYATVPPDLNPPNVTIWAVDCGFPEKSDKAETAILTVAA